MTETPNIATMNSSELKTHIADLEALHRKRLKALRALMRAREAEERAT